jgi:hypothetical protein
VLGERDLVDARATDGCIPGAVKPSLISAMRSPSTPSASVRS